MMRCFVGTAAMAAALSATLVTSAPVATHAAVSWGKITGQSPEWYRGAEAMAVVTNVLIYQRQSGGWPKNLDMARPLKPSEIKAIDAKRSAADSTIDNGATITQLRFLGRVLQATNLPAARAAFDRGLTFLFDAQYTNGGWPQFWPKPGGYHAHITFNDQAMASVLELLRDVAHGPREGSVASDAQRARASSAVDAGVRCILDTQVRVDGKLTAWCAQHDEVTLAPAPARSYEKVSLSGSESVGLVRFLMGIEQPDARVQESIHAAVAWFEAVRIRGIRVVEKRDPSLPTGRDKVVVEDPSAPPIWARFYEIGSNRPIFCGRDGVVRRRLEEIEHERRVGYAWYVTTPASLLEKEYPAWQARMKNRAP